MVRWGLGILFIALCAVLSAHALHAQFMQIMTGRVSATLHYAPNANFNGSGNYILSAYGFNLADASSLSLVNGLTGKNKALVFIGDCTGTGASNTFVAKITPFLSNAKVWGYQLTDTSSSIPGCTPALIAQESDYVHTNDPGKFTYIWMENLGSSTSPRFTDPSLGTWSIANTHLDYIGIGPYPCRSELNGGSGGCWLPGDPTNTTSYDEITAFVNAAVSAGIPKANQIPSFQAFCCGNWVNDSGGSYIMPTATQAQVMINTWVSALGVAPAFDYAYSYGQQNGDNALVNTPALLTVFCAHNGVSC